MNISKTNKFVHCYVSTIVVLTGACILATDAAAAEARVDEDAPRKVLVRLDRQSEARRQEGKDTFLHAAHNCYFDHSDDDEEDGTTVVSLRGIMAAEMSTREMLELQESGLFEVVEEDAEMVQMGWREDTQAFNDFDRRLKADVVPWGITNVQAQDVPDHPTNKIKVCVADTGYYIGHEDLPFCERDDDKCKDIVNGTDSVEYNEEWSYDGSGHGTHCAGTVGAIGNNGKGVVGVFSDPTKWSLEIGKAMYGRGYGYTSGIMEAVENCVRNGAKVVSLSLGCYSNRENCWSQTAQDFYEDLYLKDDVLLVAAAGNGGNSYYAYPASYPSLVSVAAIDKHGNRAWFSQVNSQVEIAGPGVGVLSTVPIGYYTKRSGYESWKGTSMACPHVAAVAAKVWSYFPECKVSPVQREISLGITVATPNQIEMLMIIGPPELGNQKRHEQGCLSPRSCSRRFLLLRQVHRTWPRPGVGHVQSLIRTWL